ncbi:hypothetical protein E4T56_gene19562 [Termitomyces sp. T112]|nr:hypothetical protein E4T56_gene19562 [Termitomyces sp. T112]
MTPAAKLSLTGWNLAHLGPPKEPTTTADNSAELSLQSSMSQLANPDTPSEAPALQDKAWTHLLHLETQVQLTQSSLTHHTTELSTLQQTMDLISQSLQALLECLTPNSATPAAVEPAPPTAAPVPTVPVTLRPWIPCLALPDAYDGARSAWVLSYMKTRHASTYALQVFRHPKGVGSFHNWAAFEKDFHVEFFPLDPAKTAALVLHDREQYGQGKRTLDEYIDSFQALVEQATYPDGLQLCLTFRDGLHPTLVERIDNMVEGPMATHGDPEGAPMPHFGTAPHSSQQFPPPHARSPDSSHPSMSPAAGDSYGCGCCLTTPHHSAAMLKMQEAQALCMALEALYKDDQSNGRIQEEQGGEFSSIYEPEFLDEVLEMEDQIYATTIHPPPSVTEIWASQTTSQRLAQAFAANAEPQEFQDVVPPYLHAFEDVFSKASFDSLPEHKRWDHAIELVPNSTPSSCKVYSLTPQEQDELNVFLQENLDLGCIHPSKSLMASPVFFIKKKDGSLWLVQDYRVLNTMTVKNCYPLPLISELINNLWGVRYFTKLDIQWSYNNVHIQEGDEWKAAFQTNQGLFELLMMFFGLTNSPATFQTMMNDIFWDLIAEGIVCVYLNNILIYTKMLEEHHQITRLVLERLHQHQLYLKPEKCKFEQTQIEYLSLIISHGAAEIDPVKVAGVAEWPEPRNKKEVQAFLGFANFYQRFIQDFSHHACPLFDLTGKDVTWSWGPPEQLAFDTLKHAVTSGPVLLFLDNNSPFRMEADSSDFATGAVLLQQSPEDGKWHPVAFYSKSLNWWHFLEGVWHKFEVWTDHKNLKYFWTAKKLNCQQAQWSLYLANFDFSLHHKPGQSMGKPDALSWRADHGTGEGDNSNIVFLHPKLFTIQATEGLAVDGAEVDILWDIQQGNRDGQQEELVVQAAWTLKSGHATDGILTFRDHIYVLNIPELHWRIVEQHHDSHIAGHLGQWKTLELVLWNYWWPQMSQYIGSYTSTCNICLQTKPQHRLPYRQLHPLPVPAKQWSIASVDFIVELPNAHGYDAIMVVVDLYEKRAHFIPTHTTCSAMGAANLYQRNVWKLHGLSNAYISDWGPQFVAEFTHELYQLLGVKLHTTTTYHPQSDSHMEHVNQELEQYLRLFCKKHQNDWDELLPMPNFRWHPHMGFDSQAQPLENKVVNEFVDQMKKSQEEAQAVRAKAKDNMAWYYDRRRTPEHRYQPGD